MKRSEMAEKLATFLNDSYYDEIPWGAVDGELILKMLEKAGMLPPYDSNRKFRNNDRLDCCKWEEE